MFRVLQTVLIVLSTIGWVMYSEAYKAVDVIDNLNFPVAFTFSKNGSHIWFGENSSGKIKIFKTETNVTTDFFQIPNTTAVGEGGLLGLALHPDGEKFVYAYVTRRIKITTVKRIRRRGGRPPRKVFVTVVVPENQVWRIENKNGVAGSTSILLRSKKSDSPYHDGGRILFNKTDGKLFVIIGESHDQPLAQDLKVVTGKLLRMNDDGTAPNDNPIPKSLIYAYGIRNSVGYTFDPEFPNHIWISENGPGCNDEINLVTRPLMNFGWGPKEECPNTNKDGPNITFPIFKYNDPPSLVGIAICRGCGLSGAEGHLLVGSWNEGTIRLLSVNNERNAITSDPLKFTNKNFPDFGGPRVISLEINPATNEIYFSDPTGIRRLVNDPT